MSGMFLDAEHQLNVELLKKSFDCAASRLERIVETFYFLLLEDNPELRQFFSDTDMHSQRRKLIAALNALGATLGDLEAARPMLEKLGVRHASLGVEDGHYPAVTKALVAAMEKVLGGEFTPAMQSEWQRLLEQVADIMIQGGKAKRRPGKTLSKKAEGMKTQENEGYLRLKSAVEGSGTAMMMVNNEFVITYANPATLKLIRENSEAFRKQFPGFRAENLIGTCIDIFHKDPAHQRRLLADPSNLPHTADIRVDELHFEIKVSAMLDGMGSMLGNALEWKNVTELKRKELDIGRLQSLIENATNPVTVVDKDAIITYANPALTTLMRKYAEEMRKALPRLDVENIIGSNIDIYHKNPDLQRRLLANESLLPYKAEIQVGPLHFALNVFALRDLKGKRIGTAVEWTDNNAREIYRREVEELIRSASEGNLTHRGDVEKMDGNYKPMLLGINQIIETAMAPISELQEKLQRVADGDLTAYVTGHYKGDHAILKQALNRSLDSLNQMLGQVKVSGEQIAAGSKEVATTSQALSQGATEQAASLEEITASLTEMSGQTKQNAENASQANQLADAARGSAEGGSQQMGNMVKAMKDIDESSKSISKIIKVIDEIAFQTNLLALNAAVEAARAGTHGKGFAVVAEEVRNLAARSAKAAKETTDLIESSIKKVDAGTSIANQTQEALQEIVSSVSKVNDLVGEIAASSNEQAQGIRQINQGLTQLDSVTQQNTASAEQSASASEELSGQATNLREMLNRFRLKEPEKQAPTGAFPPELLQAFEAFLRTRGQSGGANDWAPSASTGTGSSPHLQNAPSQEAAREKRKVNPNDIINLDDAEFGKY